MYQFNREKIHNISDFIEKYNHTCAQKSILFLRMQGDAKGYENALMWMDQKGKEYTAEKKIGGYARWKGMPRMTDIDMMNRCTRACEQWLNSGRTQCVISSFARAESLGRDFALALSFVVERYERYASGVNDSMVKNFATKVIYWVDSLGSQFFEGMDECRSYKLVIEGIEKKQEYLGVLVMGILGIDVLMLDRKGTGDCSAVLDFIEQMPVSIPMNLSVSVNTMTVNADGRLRISAASLRHPNRPVPGRPDMPSGGVRQPITARQPIPPRQSSTERQSITVRESITAGHPIPPRQPSTVAQPDNRVPISSGAQEEKSYEELANLASSVVMIAIADEKKQIIGSGSGIMIGRNGYILTNNHVARNGVFYLVRIEDDDEVYVTDQVIKYNQVADLAIIKIDRQLNPLKIYDGKKKLARGQKVVAIGSPLGLFNSVSDGIISGFRIGEDRVKMIQFTAPISHGSSGGAVLDMYGDVIGISTAGYDDGQNINLAVSYEEVNEFVRGFTN